LDFKQAISDRLELGLGKVHAKILKKVALTKPKRKTRVAERPVEGSM
jgi:hypothetical protein